MRTVSLALALSLVVVASASGQNEVWRIHGTSSVPDVGASVAWLSDVNGDGVPDFVAGGPALYEDPDGSGHVLVASGADGTILLDFAGAPKVLFGYSVARAGDADGDGIDDVAVGAPANGNGVVRVYSSVTGALLRTLTGASAGAQFGTSLADLGDVDGDGIRDLAIGAPLDASTGSQLGLVEIVSGATGVVLAQWNGASVGGGFGSVVADAGDLDGDGLHDLLVIEQDDANTGELSAYSSATFQRLWKLNLGPPRNWIARGAGDVNGDGIADVIVGNPNWPVTQSFPFNLYGGVWIYDGKTGALIRSHSQQLFIGWAVSDAGDWNGDGFADYAFGVVDSISVGIEIVSGKTGNVLAHDYFSCYSAALGGGVDVNGDGKPDLLVGLPSDSTNGENSGAAGAIDFVTYKFVDETFGTTSVDSLGQTSALLDDVDGDGTRDLLVGVGGDSFSLGRARVLSGVDGHVLREHSGATISDSYAKAVAALPDVDGDGVGEYAITVPGPGHVEVRSGATGNLIRTLTLTNGGGAQAGWSVAAAIQPSGAVQLAVGDPHWNPGVDVFDVATGSIVVSAAPPSAALDFGTSVAYVGDVDGDGTGDWAAGSPNFNYSNGSVTVFSGATGNTLLTLTETGSGAFGAAVGGPGDVDGDGVPDVLIGASREAPVLAQVGAAYLYSGATGNLLYTWSGSFAELGASIAVLGDLNGDGVTDFLIGERGRAFLYSGATKALLYRFDGTTTDQYFGWSPPGVAAPGSTGSMNGDAIPDVAIGAFDDSERGWDAGRLSLYFLDDLYLQILPPRAATGTYVQLATSGGPTGHLAALFAVAFDGTPMFQLCALGKLDAQGLWSAWGTVPPGLSGHTLTFSSFTVGFAGKAVGTEPMTLTFK